MENLDAKIALLAEQLGLVAKANHHVVCTAESCTGGAIAAAITEVPGSSAWFEMGCVTYATASKTALLDIDPAFIAEHNVVSEPVAMAMARGMLARSQSSTLAAAVTGLAGPGGGTPERPVGTVCVGWAERFNEHIVCTVRTIHVNGSRRDVRQAAVYTALSGLMALMNHGNPAAMPLEL